MLTFHLIDFNNRKLKAIWHRHRMSLDDLEVDTRWELDFQQIENECLFDEYLEMGKSTKPVVNSFHTLDQLEMGNDQASGQFFPHPRSAIEKGKDQARGQFCPHPRSARDE
jgi:hypothetical protein